MRSDEDLPASRAAATLRLSAEEMSSDLPKVTEQASGRRAI